MATLTSPDSPHAVAPAARIEGLSASDFGRLLLRWTIGGLILLHGLSKVTNGPGSLMPMLQGHGLPATLAWGVYLGEVVAPLLLIVGVWTRAAALVIVVNMLFALGLVHLNDLGRINQSGGWAVELQVMYLLGAAAIALLGAGRIGLGGPRGRWN